VCYCYIKSKLSFLRGRISLIGKTKPHMQPNIMLLMLGLPFLSTIGDGFVHWIGELSGTGSENPRKETGSPNQAAAGGRLSDKKVGYLCTILGLKLNFANLARFSGADVDYSRCSASDNKDRWIQTAEFIITRSLSRIVIGGVWVRAEHESNSLGRDAPLWPILDRLIGPNRYASSEKIKPFKYIL
jgi:hypothetical protein